MAALARAKAAGDFSAVAAEALRRHVADRAQGIPVSAALLSLSLAAGAIFICQATQLTLNAFPNIVELLAALVAADIGCRYVTQSAFAQRAPVVLYTVTFVAVTCIIGVYSSYATQRLGMPLQDPLLLAADRALGFDSAAFIRWADQYPLLAAFFRSAYATMALQIVLPVFALGFFSTARALRVYVLAFALVLAVTILVAALLPAISAVNLVDRASLHAVQLSGSTPVEHLMRLREPGPVRFLHGIGGLLSFPSFHVASTFVATFCLRAFRPIFFGLLVVNALLICGTVTEGGHYIVDAVAGVALALFACWLAERANDRELSGRLPA